MRGAFLCHRIMAQANPDKSFGEVDFGFLFDGVEFFAEFAGGGF
jgi:hypothetical protein